MTGRADSSSAFPQGWCSSWIVYMLASDIYQCQLCGLSSMTFASEKIIKENLAYFQMRYLRKKKESKYGKTLAVDNSVEEYMNVPCALHLFCRF